MELTTRQPNDMDTRPYMLGSPSSSENLKSSVGVVPSYIMVARQDRQVDSDDEADANDYMEAANQQPHNRKEDKPEDQSLLKRLDKRFSHMVNVESSVADSEDFPVTCKWITFIIYVCAICGLGAYLFYTSYIDGRTKTFITLDRFSGVCKDDSSMDTCCEVPASITGTYLADNAGTWNTESAFSYVKQIYAVSVTGLTYTNSQWKELMTVIKKRLYDVAEVRGSLRDISWNLVAWASFTAISNKRGFLQFYSAGDISVMFDKPVYDMGYASKQTDNAACDINAYGKVTNGWLSITQNLNYTFDNSTKKWNCEEQTSRGNKIVHCDNPCPGIFPNPEALGYDNQRSESSTFTWSVDMSAVLTALAINMKITPLANLQRFDNDTNRLEMIEYMMSINAIDPVTASKMSSYFELLYAPTEPIYCIDYDGDGNTVSCLVRIHNTLFYPVMSSYGYIDELPHNTTTSSITANSFSTDGKEFPEDSDRLKQFQESSFVKDHPEIVSGNAGFNTFSVSSSDVRKQANRVRLANYGLQESPSATSASDPKMLKKNRMLQLESVSGLKPGAKSTIKNVPVNYADDITLNNKKKRTNWLQDLKNQREQRQQQDQQVNIEEEELQRLREQIAGLKVSEETKIKLMENLVETMATNNSTSNSTDNSNSYTDYYVFKQCNIIAYWMSNGAILDACDQFDVILGLVYYPTEAQYDNGKIFKLAETTARRVASDLQYGDISAQYVAFDAMFSSLYGDSTYVREKTSTFTDIFSSICSSADGGEDGCSLFSINFYGGADRTLSIYEYQPTGQMAFKNSLYDDDTMKRIAVTPPTRLTQSYYSCVMSPWESAYAASGLAASNTQLYVGIGLIVYMYLAVYCLHFCLKKKEKADEVRWKMAKIKEEEMKQSHIEDFIFSLQEDIRAGRLGGDVIAARESMQRYEEETTEFREAERERMNQFKNLIKRKKSTNNSNESQKDKPVVATAVDL